MLKRHSLTLEGNDGFAPAQVAFASAKLVNARATLAAA
jgi:hypothetical protein